MPKYDVYLEIGDDGRCLAHVLDLPGLVVRAQTRDEALNRLPGTITEYHAWLRRHGEPALPFNEKIEVSVAGESVGFGPFETRSAAALFPPDRKPLSPTDMEDHLRLMSHSRTDLLALVDDLPDDVLDWEPGPESFTIRKLLRHVGNAEKWYVTRLVAPESLPPEWDKDDDVPIFEYLDMERQTIIARLGKLTDTERSEVLVPAGWSAQPEEPWTARKAMRRFLEHEREHTWQVHEILHTYRIYLLARIAAARAGLLARLLGQEETTLTSVGTAGDWTVKDLLAHLAEWDRWQDRTMRCIVSGVEPDLTALADFEATNAAFVAHWQDHSLDEVVAELEASRGEWVSWLESLPLEEFYQQRSLSGRDWSFFTGALPIMWQHDAEYSEQIAIWRHGKGKAGAAGPKSVLLAALGAARTEFLTAARLIPQEEWNTRLVCGEWTLKDVVGHLADWEWFGAEGMRLMALGQAPMVEEVTDIDAWNRAHVQVRLDQPWAVVWDDLLAARNSMLGTLAGIDDAKLSHTFPFPWGQEGTPYQWAAIFVSHDREHARDLQDWVKD